MFDSDTTPWTRLPMRLQQHPALLEADAEVAALTAELETISARLGTPDERPGDIEAAQAAGHRLRNLICGLALLGSFGPRR